MSNETKQIFPALIAIMNDVEAIGKNKKNQMQNFMYRGIDDMYNDLQPKFAKHKVFITSEVLESTREDRVSKSGGNNIYTILKVKFTFYAEDGSSVSSIMVGEAMDSGDKGANKAMSIALKYCLIQLLLIPTEETAKDDNDGHTTQVATKPAQQPANKPQPQPAPILTPLTDIEVTALIEQISKCGSVDTLNNLYATNKTRIGKHEGVIKAFGDRKKELQTQPVNQN